MLFASPDKTYGAGGVAKLTMKAKKTSKSDHIILESITRTEFVRAYLGVHDLGDQYSPGVHSGPSFKLWWAGSP
jgi:hypothetical protein